MLKIVNKKVIGRVLFVLLFIAAVYFFITSRTNLNTVMVKKVDIQKRYVEKTVSSSGEIKSQSEVELGFGVSGTVKTINVRKGDQVKKGTLLASVDTYKLYNDMLTYRDSRDIAIRDRDLYVQNYSTNVPAIGGETEYYLGLRRQDELVSKAQASYNSAQATLSESYIYSPFDGTIVDVTKDAGENVLTTEHVIKLADLGKVEFETDLDQEDYGLVKEGQSVTINLDSFDGVDFIGIVTTLPLYANGGATPNFTVKIALQPKEGYKPLMGMTGDAHIIVAKSESEVSSIYYDELFYDDENKPYVWVVDNGFVTKQVVEIGLEGDIYTELKILPDKQVVVGVNTDVEVKDGYKAKVVL
ncbi:hypothetical protein A3K34_02150 [candidate division WWE3 bacterium RIFOXYC1_FULL_40_10]|uniref:CzcB-like barrel-sandwich hybrid domain-containing protein n=1 Tax=candidate division WWE3 bacterium RIFOXYA2_FULL_46_9 TaxID=1802636 RepID=A0A1F4W1I1_UNCKA|nr:MAG: hypothetical protein A3K58_02150 [candidate division WWE3 bacterium RIFOXYB1_FULL_40_22]OGC61656.1 MAG: hypothetical protein A3K37_02150 [candidate division WWE3 bacterium RIFOXYA1_FULL_40_11]OGC63282.1 MAG: hypothetical protein A2264_02770 [candidate division WWE3 bacterium RIFOXYA2_FULL_46_9]OGC64413.1 MAG: hypothetical protein A2326_02605 [candidate division WWE3 bacterium RIFOXYB2_FULL_41_6]OGC66039.1 MAG: hypothetical protein A3K34_02150 [candidate division WWE3 bacterium RIFOXYC1_